MQGTELDSGDGAVEEDAVQLRRTQTLPRPTQCCQRKDMNRSSDKRRSRFLYTSLGVGVQRTDILFPTRSTKEDGVKKGLEEERASLLGLESVATWWERMWQVKESGRVLCNSDPGGAARAGRRGWNTGVKGMAPALGGAHPKAHAEKGSRDGAGAPRRL